MDSIERRLARLETRLVQMMMHFGLDPYEKMHAKQQPNNQYRSSFNFDSSRFFQASGEK